MTSANPRVKALRRILPATPAQTPVTTKLSITDAIAVRFAPCAAIWLYDKPEAVSVETLVDALEQTLAQTLDDYRQFTGRVRYATEEDVKDAVDKRILGRPVVTHGFPDDHGAELVVAEYERDLVSIVPDWKSRSSTQKAWDATDFPQKDFFPATPLALSSLSVVEGQPLLIVQLTTFRCGGFAVGVKIAHYLSDALTLVNFVHAWAARTQALFGADTGAAPFRPLFDPSLLDLAAKLNVDGTSNEALVAQARALPIHRYDWCAEDAPGQPSWAKATSRITMPSEARLAHSQLSPSTYPPWPTWSMAAPVQHFQIRFAADEVARLKEHAQATLPEGLKGFHVSRQDAALAHIWILINRARQHEASQEHVYLDVTLGLRARLDPPLPDSWVGSPTVMAHVSKTGTEASTSPLGVIAADIRQTLALFTPDAVTALLHDAAHEVSPQRLWQGFLGAHHTMVTSWARAGAYEVDFVGGGLIPRYVQGVMPRLDGLVQIIDVGKTGDLDFSVCLRSDVAGRLIADPLL